MNQAEFYKANVGLVHTVSRKGFARLSRARVVIDYDDVFQEMSIVFLKACAGFDPTRGFRFSTYFFMAAYNRLNVWAAALIKDRTLAASVEQLSDHGEGELNLEEIILQDLSTPEGFLAAKQMAQRVSDSLSPLAALLFSWSLDPPKQIMDEIEKARLNAEFGRSLGYATRNMVQLTPRYVAGFVRMISDISQSEINRALKEIDAMKASVAKELKEA